MKAKNSMPVSGGNFEHAHIHVGDKIITKVSKGNNRATHYPVGCIGADLAKRNYVKYLVDRYHKHREADGSFGRDGVFHAKQLQAKCASKYAPKPGEPAAPGKSMTQNQNSGSSGMAN